MLYFFTFQDVLAKEKNQIRNRVKVPKFGRMAQNLKWYACYQAGLGVSRPKAVDDGCESLSSDESMVIFFAEPQNNI